MFSGRIHLESPNMSCNLFNMGSISGAGKRKMMCEAFLSVYENVHDCRLKTAIPLAFHFFLPIVVIIVQ